MTIDSTLVNENLLKNQVHPFHIYPAIDLLDGESVRLEKGLRSTATKVYASAVEQILWYESLGAIWVHIVNLNAAFGDDPNSMESQKTKNVLAKLGATTKLKIQLGGGIRSKEAFLRCIDLGINKLVIGTWATKDPNSVSLLAQDYGEKIVVGLDTIGNPPKIAIKGWTETASTDPIAFATTLRESGCNTFLHTDVERDGLLKGANLELSAQIAKNAKVSVLLSGGVRNEAEILKARNTPGITGVILGKVLHSSLIDIEKVLKTH